MNENEIVETVTKSRFAISPKLTAVAAATFFVAALAVAAKLHAKPSSDESVETTSV